MGKSAEALISPEVLTWARKAARMSVEAAAGRLGVAPEKLQAWESGDSKPTVKQLRKAAAVYKQTFAAFYLPQAPTQTMPSVRDFRTISSGGRAERSPELAFDFRAALDRRSVSLELYHAMRETPPDFAARTSLRHAPEQVGVEIRRLLGITYEEQRRWRETRVGFNRWRQAIESMGVLVFQSKGVDLPEMRGYSIAEFPLPVIVANRKDAYAGWSFTVLHELTHLMLHVSGICDLEEHGSRSPTEERIEAFCNRAAGAALIPRDDLLRESLVRSHSGYAWEDEELRALAKTYATSREAVLTRLLVLGRTDQEFYETKQAQFHREYEARPRSEGFVSPDQDVVSTAGKPFVSLVLAAYNAEQIIDTDVADYFGVRLSYLPGISDLVGTG